MLCYKTSQPEPPHSSLIKSCHLRASGWPPLRSRQCHLLNGCIISNTPWDCPLCRRPELAAMRGSLDPANWQWIFSGKPGVVSAFLYLPAMLLLMQIFHSAHMRLCLSPQYFGGPFHPSLPLCRRCNWAPLPVCTANSLRCPWAHPPPVTQVWGCSSEWKHMRGCLFTSRPILQLPFNQLPTSQSAHLKSATLISPVLLSFCVSLPVSSHNNLNF